MTTAFFSLAYPEKDPGSASVHLKTCLLPEASLDAGSFTGWGAWLADVIMKTSIARCLRKTEGDFILLHGTQAPTSPQAQRQKFLEGRGAGRENLFPKRFPSPQAFLSSHLQAPACRPQNKKIPGGAGTKKDPLALRAARGSRTIFGSGLLSHMTLCSIIGDGELNFRVRNGVGCTLSSMATKEIW